MTIDHKVARILPVAAMLIALGITFTTFAVYFH